MIQVGKYLHSAKCANYSVYYCIGTLDRRRCRFESAEAHFIKAQNTWLAGDQTRIHPFNAAIVYKIGTCCLDQGKVEASM
jgi:hypothetical protein